VTPNSERRLDVPIEERREKERETEEESVRMLLR